MWPFSLIRGKFSSLEATQYKVWGRQGERWGAGAKGGKKKLFSLLASSCFEVSADQLSGRLRWQVLSDNNICCMSCSLFWPCTFVPTILPLCHLRTENIGKIGLKRNMPFGQQENSVKNCNSNKVSRLCSPIVWQIYTRRTKNITHFCGNFRPMFIKNSSQYFVQRYECKIFKSITYYDATVWL